MTAPANRHPTAIPAAAPVDTPSLCSIGTFVNVGAGELGVIVVPGVEDVSTDVVEAGIDVVEADTDVLDDRRR